MRFREQATETAGFYNTVSFNDDTRAFLSISARHDVARRIDCAGAEAEPYNSRRSALDAIGHRQHQIGIGLTRQIEIGTVDAERRLLALGPGQPGRAFLGCRAVDRRPRDLVVRHP